MVSRSADLPLLFHGTVLYQEDLVVLFISNYLECQRKGGCSLCPLDGDLVHFLSQLVLLHGSRLTVWSRPRILKNGRRLFALCAWSTPTMLFSFSAPHTTRVAIHSCVTPATVTLTVWISTARPYLDPSHRRMLMACSNQPIYYALSVVDSSAVGQ